MESVSQRRMVGVAFATVIAVAAIVGVFLVTHRAPTVNIEGAPVGYSSVAELLEANGLTLVVRPIGDPQSYVDYGADGKPDFEGQAGLPTELIVCTVTSVLRGDPGLLGQSVVVSQPSPDVRDAGGSRESDRLSTGNSYVIVASERRLNPGVGDGSGPVLVPAPWGYGVYDDLGNGLVAPRVSGLFDGEAPFDQEAFDVRVFVDAE